METGKTTSVCNIFDMGGNAWEWTTENCVFTFSPCVTRGYYSAGCRSWYASTYSENNISFRVALYL